MATVKEAGIVFRHGEHCWFAPMSGPFICRGGIKALADPEQSFAEVRADQIILVDAEDIGGSIRLRQKGVVSVSFNGDKVCVADMVRDQRTLQILQGLITELHAP